MSIQQTYPRKRKFSRWSTGLTNSQYLKNVYSTSFGYTSAMKKVSAGTATAILASTASTTSPQTITSGISNPDVPRALSVTVGGTAANVLDSTIVITGTNSEGKVITESFLTTANSTGTINGAKAFMTVTSIAWPAQLGTSATITVGTQNKLGVYHRLIPNNTTVKVIQSTPAALVGTSTNAVPALPTIQGVPTVVADATYLENNLVTPLTTPDGTTFLYICYQYDNWKVGDINDGASGQNALYATSTSTSSTSSSTSTSSLTTSTSSTSSSTSSTSSSTSSTSSSTSSTSTSTTTTPWP